MTQMVAEWGFVQAEQYCDSVRDGTHDSPKFVDQGYPLITSKNIKEGRIDNRSVSFICLRDYEEINRRSKVEQWDVLISMIGTVGEVCLVEDEQPSFAIKNLGLFKCKSELDGRWLFYWLRSPKAIDYVRERLRGTSQQYISLGELRKLPVLRPKNEATKARLIDAIRPYDDLIETNRRRIVLLEEAVRLLYREWFVKLRFPGHAQCKMVDGLPEGWSRQPLSALIEESPKTPFEKDKIYPFVPMQSLSESSMVIGAREQREISGGAKFQNLDTLLARITPCLENGKTGFVQFLDDDLPVASGSTEFIVLRSKSVSPYWVYCLAREDSFREHAIRSMAGADGRQRVKPECFNTYMTLQPPASVLQEFDAIMEPLFSEAEILARQNVRLQEARDVLLPKLMSGEIQGWILIPSAPRLKY